jgi:hypothetical protein
MVVYAQTYDGEGVAERTLELGYFSEQELNAFSVLIHRRRCLPIFLGDSWRCPSCRCERRDLVAMANHILATHPPEPFNEEDLLELQQRRCA